MRTLVFCTSYARAPEAWSWRMRLWVSAMHAGKLADATLLIVDDASPCMPDWPEVRIITKDWEQLTAGGLTIFRFSQHLGRQGRDLYPGWFRSFTFAARYAVRHGFERVVHVESDAFLVSEAAQTYMAGATDGWIAMASETHKRMPETCVQVMAGAGLRRYFDFAQRRYSGFGGSTIEMVLPFTAIESGLRGGRYGETRTVIPQHADWAAQMHPVASRERAYYWWLPDWVFSREPGAAVARSRFRTTEHS